MNNRRKYKRFSATAFLNLPVLLSPLQPYFGHPVKGRLIDLSAGGMALSIHEIIPLNTNLDLKARFPDNSVITCVVQVKRVLPRNKNFLIGIEFLNLTEDLVQMIEKMSADYIDCESRIQAQEANVCVKNCQFYSMCTKPERMDSQLQEQPSLILDFSLAKEEVVPVSL